MPGLNHSKTIVVAWQNIWEWGAGKRAYILANAGFKVTNSICVLLGKMI